MPTTPNPTSGFLLFVPTKDITRLSMNIEEGMKLVISGGIITPKYLKSKRNIPFSFFGPTCDSNDFMEGPFFLPENMKEGDFIEIGLVGAYAQTMRTTFNGFSLSNKLISVRDKPINSQKNIP